MDHQEPCNPDNPCKLCYDRYTCEGSSLLAVRKLQTGNTIVSSPCLTVPLIKVKVINITARSKNIRPFVAGFCLWYHEYMKEENFIKSIIQEVYEKSTDQEYGIPPLFSFQVEVKNCDFNRLKEVPNFNFTANYKIN